MAWLATAAAAVVTAGTGVASTIASFSDARKRSFYEQNVAALSYDQQKKLNDDLMKANSEQARQQILANTIGNISTARVGSLSALAVEKEKTNKIVTIIGLGAGILLFGGIIFVITKNNK